MSELQPGTILVGRYHIDTKLGEGGMAVIFRAFDIHRRVPVALKVLKPDDAEAATCPHKFQCEAQNLKHLQHLYMVRFYEVAVLLLVLMSASIHLSADMDSSSSTTNNAIILPYSAKVQITVNSAITNSCDGNFGIQAPSEQELF